MPSEILPISLETLIAASPLLGHELEDRSPIRTAQQPHLVRTWQEASTVSLRHADQQHLFCVAPLDLLVTQADGEKQFHLLELNGTGIGGLTNLAPDATNACLSSLGQMAEPQLEMEAAPLILVASSGRECEQNPRLNRLIYEKLLYAEALKRGFESADRSPVVAAMPQLRHDPTPLARLQPAIVVGYIKEFLEALTVTDDGWLTLFGRKVTGAVNDRFCAGVLSQFDGLVDLSRFSTMNRCHLAGADKGVAYGLLNDFLQARPQPYFPSQIEFDVATSREALIETVLAWRERGRKPVIKPHGTGLGHGIEFFLADEPDADVLKKIDRSIKLTQEYYRATGGVFPYTVCEYVDACTVPDRGHPLFGHKYELRVVVYRDAMTLRAFPSIIKVASEPFDARHPEPSGLINNITASCMKTHAKGTDYMFPLANRQTLDLFGLNDQHLIALCSAATGYVRHVLDQIERQPTRLGLPTRPSPISRQAPALLSGV